MRLITLNIWGGKIHKDFFEFINKHKDSTDIFTFQEVYKSDHAYKTPNGYYTDIFKQIEKELPDFKSYFSPQFHGRDFDYLLDFPVSQGTATFWRNNLKEKEKSEFWVFNKENEIIPVVGSSQIIPPRNVLFVVFDNFMILNLHGYWEPAPKHDTPERLKQSKLIIDFIEKRKLPAIVAGDFNLRMESKSVEMFTDAGFRNLVKESKAKTTRSTLYSYKWRRNDKFADYIFTSKGIWVTEFKVLKDRISDHLPLLIDFNA